jgi:hypothetical protein
MKIEALTEHYQTRRKTALNRVPVEPEKFARPQKPAVPAARHSLLAKALHPHASSSHYFGADIRRCPHA